MGRNSYGPILAWAEMVMGRNDQLPFITEYVFKEWQSIWNMAHFQRIGRNGILSSLESVMHD